LLACCLITHTGAIAPEPHLLQLPSRAHAQLVSDVGHPQTSFFSLLCTPVVLTCPWLPGSHSTQHLTNAYLTSVHSQSLQPCLPPTSLDLRSPCHRHLPLFLHRNPLRLPAPPPAATSAAATPAPTASVRQSSPTTIKHNRNKYDLHWMHAKFHVAEWGSMGYSDYFPTTRRTGGPPLVLNSEMGWLWAGLCAI